MLHTTTPPDSRLYPANLCHPQTPEYIHGLLTHTAIEIKAVPLDCALISSSGLRCGNLYTYIYSSIKSSLNPFPALLGLKYEQPPSAIWALCFRFLIVGCCDSVAEEERMWAALLSGFRDG